MIKAVASFFLGALISAVGVLLHNAFHPIGILLALIATAVGINFVGQAFGSRKFKIIAGVGWLAVALRAGSYGLSNEILIISNVYGNLFLLGGLFIATVAAIKKI